ncbi:MAG: glycosyltransferase [Alphaproteobacteria bacterium]|nr:glycosyltransferase [Alphaproteobacteria bacterium]
MEKFIPEIAVLIPCYNEELTIGTVIQDFQKYVPNGKIYVYDNNSTDETKRIAAEHGAIVRSECLQGKGNVVRRMFSDVDADVYVMIDGDATYDVKSVPELIRILLSENLDMVVGARKETEQSCYRSGHRSGNKFLTKTVELFLGQKLTDMLSGLRVFSKRYVKSFPANSAGFEIETELTVYALSRRLPIKEIDTCYYARPEGSFSKLSTYKDGVRILKTIIMLIKEEKPFLFFNLIALFFMLIGIVLIIPVMIEFINTGMVPRFPTAILSGILMVCSLVSFLIGLVLDSITITRKELSRQNYLKIR